MRRKICLFGFRSILLSLVIWIETAGAKTCAEFVDGPKERNVSRIVALGPGISLEESGAQLFSLLQKEMDLGGSSRPRLWIPGARTFSHFFPGPLSWRHFHKDLLKLPWRNVRQHLDRHPDLLRYSPSKGQPPLGLLLFHPKLVGANSKVLGEFETVYYKSLIEYLFQQASLYHQIPEFLSLGVRDQEISLDRRKIQPKALQSPLLTLISKHQWEPAKKLILHSEFDVESAAGKELVNYVDRHAENPEFFSNLMDAGFLLFLKMQKFSIDFEVLSRRWTKGLHLISLYQALDRGIIQISPGLILSLKLPLAELKPLTPMQADISQGQMIEKLHEVREGGKLLLEYLSRAYFQTPEYQEARVQLSLALTSLDLPPLNQRSDDPREN
ncbi:MAG: hypothetical protein WCH11_00770 [Bdellovibrio sp.]